MSDDQIAAEMATLLAAPYSRDNQRRVALLMGFDSDLVFGDRSGEDTFEQVIKFAMQVSLSISGEETTLRHSYASYMLYRICTVAGSVTELYNRHEGEPLTTLDYSSIAVLCRTIIDASAQYFAGRCFRHFIIRKTPLQARTLLARRTYFDRTNPE
jgi:hypothetical protein